MTEQLLKPNLQSVPEHIAVIMDGNGRWAKERNLPRIAGHHAGVEMVREITKAAHEHGVKALTLFAFGMENWKRPSQEVKLLLSLFSSLLRKEADKLHKENVQFRIIGDKSRFSKKIQESIAYAEQLTEANTGLKLVIAISYSGRWDLAESLKKIAEKIKSGQLTPENIDSDLINQHLSTADLPEPDLLIRTSGEQRLSNFLLWQMAYTELYFTPVYWPDFNRAAFIQALDFYAHRQRRFGCTSEQIQEVANA